ncbi:unnamed protein product [Ectocarpus sp. CCAP 1310/34]|nr:unnamed protein product [Ectocarpus sp. CCAP 1310/34]
MLPRLHRLEGASAATRFRETRRCRGFLSGTPKKKGGGGRGGSGAGAKPSDAGGRGKAGGGRGGAGRPTDATVIQKLSERVSSGATSGVGLAAGGGRDPLKGVDVAGLEEISIAEGDWQSVFRLLKDIGLFDSAGPDGGNSSSGSTLSSAGPTPPPRNTTSPGDPGGPNTATGPGASSRQTSAEPAAAGASARTTTAATTAAAPSNLPTAPATSQTQQEQQHDPAIMSYLTKLLAFPEADAATALSNTSGNDLAEALDYLCLHTDDAGLKRGFRRGSGGGGGGGVGHKGGGRG